MLVLIFKINDRVNSKITVIDGHIAWCGSQNCADEEFIVKAKYAPWIDIMLRFKGPIVAQCQLFATLLTLARKEVVISTPYFVPNSTVLNAICAAAIRGVDVKLILPKRNDSWIVAAASHSYYKQLLNHSVKIFEFREGLLHSKTLTLDRTISLIGSSNIDLRSFDLNYENDIIFRDNKLTTAIYTRQLDYINKSDWITIEDVESWGYIRRVWNNIVATVGPIL